MNWFIRFLGTKDKEQRKRTQEVADYVHGKKNRFSIDMGRLHIQAKKAHNKSKEAFHESTKTLQIVESITAQLDIVSGGKRRRE